MAVAQTIQRLTEAQYLERERRAESRSEFFDGEVFAMAGGTRAHSAIGVNLLRELSTSLKGRPCVVYNADLRVKVEGAGLYTYPDASVVCGTPQFLDSAEDTLLNPQLLGEVLSDSTEAYDRGKKFELYRQIASLSEYLIISQREPLIELFVRQADGQWLLREARGLSATIELPVLKATLALSEIYAKVEFVAAPIRQRDLSPQVTGCRAPASF